MTTMEHVWANFIISNGLQILMCIIALITSLRTVPTRRKDLEEGANNPEGV